MSSCLRLVSEQFPLLHDRVAWLFVREPLFRELCEDYEACRLALDRHEAAEALMREYSALRLRLETEILRFLHDAAVKSGGSN